MENLLRPLIGENIDLVTHLSSDAGRSADPGQIEQVIMNLVVNAKDSMPEGGRITSGVSTSISARMSVSRFIQPGRYAVIAVSEPATALTARRSPASSSLSSPPRKTAKAPASACRLSTASSSKAMDTSSLKARLGPAPHFTSIYRG